MNATMDKINDVFRNVFDDDELTVTRQTTASNVEGWDSVMHVTLLINVEKAFGVKLSSSAVGGMKTVGDLVDLIEAQGGSPR